MTSIWYCTFATGATIILALDPAMIPGSDRPALPARLIPAHYAIAALSLLALIIVQTNWDALFVQSAIETWPIYIAVLILAATAWLLSTAWLHLAIARQRSRPLAPQPGRAALHAVTDLLVAASATAVLLQGHRSPLALAGLWAVPPALLAIGIPSALLLAAAAFREQHLNHAFARRPALDLARVMIALVLLISLVLLATRPLPETAHIPLTTANWADEPAGFVSSAFNCGSGCDPISTRNVSVCLPAASSRSTCFAASNGSASSQTCVASVQAISIATGPAWLTSISPCR